MTIKQEKEAKELNHTRWAEEINRRNARYSDESNWFPFVQNLNEVLERIDVLTQRIDELDNKIGETTGMVKNLRKVLIKLEVVDDRFVF